MQPHTTAVAFALVACTQQAPETSYNAVGATVCAKACDNIRHYQCREGQPSAATGMSCEAVCEAAEARGYGTINAEGVANATTLDGLHSAGVRCLPIKEPSK